MEQLQRWAKMPMGTPMTDEMIEAGLVAREYIEWVAENSTMLKLKTEHFKFYQWLGTPDAKPVLDSFFYFMKNGAHIVDHYVGIAELFERDDNIRKLTQIMPGKFMIRARLTLDGYAATLHGSLPNQAVQVTLDHTPFDFDGFKAAIEARTPVHTPYWTLGEIVDTEVVEGE